MLATSAITNHSDNVIFFSSIDVNAAILLLLPFQTDSYFLRLVIDVIGNWKSDSKKIKQSTISGN
jgi:hypothetical protein